MATDLGPEFVIEASATEDRSERGRERQCECLTVLKVISTAVHGLTCVVLYHVPYDMLGLLTGDTSAEKRNRTSPVLQ